ncbi:MAG: HAD hydrolase-like protein, partial [Actinomycetes bacterium]
MTGPVVGFDLDMTLIDTTPGFTATLSALSREVDVEFDVEAMCRRLGPPIDEMLAPYFPAEQLPGLADRFRALYPEHAIPVIEALEGAHEALAAVRRHRGQTVVVTGKVRRNAVLHVDGLRFDIDHLVGGVWGTGKGQALREHGASVYVGDHVLDIAGAREAGALSVSVLTGGCSEQELYDAGTDVVLEHLGDFPDWLDEHLLTQRLAALEAILREHESVLVAFSGGADSAFLLAAAVRALGPDKVAAAMAYSDSLPHSERGPALDFCRDLEVRVFTPETHEMGREGYRAN